MSEKRNLSNKLKQPRMLYLLSFIELCERFAHYSMRGIIILYMTKILLYSNEQSYGIFAGFSALLFFTPFIGGQLADRFLGAERAILYGGSLLTMGYLLLALPNKECFYFALALIAIGGGFFMPNMSAIVGQLYKENDAQREAGYSIFYGAINLGALIPPIIITSIIMRFSWHAAFIVAALSVFAGMTIFYFVMGNFEELSKKTESKKSYIIIWLGIFLMIPLLSEIIKLPNYANKIVFSFGICFFLHTFKRSFAFTKVQRNCLMVCFFLTLFSIICEMLLMQTAMSLTIFVEYNVNRDFAFWQIPTVMFQALNPLFIICFAPLMSKLWIALENKNLNPSIPTKFAFGTLLIGMSFIILPIAISESTTGKISSIWIVACYLLQSWGELLVAPVGMAMIVEMSPRSMIGLMMGVWSFATAVASLLAGIISQWTTLNSNYNSPIVTGPTYAHTFEMLGIISISAAFLMFAIIPKLKTVFSAKIHENVIMDPA